MFRLLLLFPALAACAPSPRKVVMSSPSPTAADTSRSVIEANAGKRASALPGTAATQGPIPDPVSVVEVATAPMPPTDTSATALGRRILSTAFVRVGPGGHLTIDLRNGDVLMLRDVVMAAKDYCGVRVSGKRYCGAYAEVVGARAEGVPVIEPADPGAGIRAVPTREAGQL